MDTIPQDDTPCKQCLTCLEWLPATTEYFHSHPHGRYGVIEHCKECRQAKRRKTPRPEPVPEGYKRCSKCKEIKPSTVEYFHRQTKPHRQTELRSACKQCLYSPKPPAESRPGQKQCFTCKNWFPATTDYFQRDKAMKDGFLSWCKPCALERARLRREEARVHPPERPETLACKKCGEIKPITEFPTRLRNRYGVLEQCKPCVNADHRLVMQKPEQKDKMAILNHRHYENNKAQVQERHRQWKQDNPEWVVANAANRRALERSVPGEHTAEQIKEQLKRQKYRCYYAACGFSKFPRIKENGKWKYLYHVEHTYPLSRVAGTDVPANDMGYIVLACESCNQSKFNKYPWEWPEGGRLL